MKWIFASDLHGSAFYTQQLIAAFTKENAERLVLLGDLLYHGPRNDLPKEYAPKEVITMLNPLADKLLCVRGNCDAEVDQMVLDFPILADYAAITYGNSMIYATHGHLFHKTAPPPLGKKDILLCGHTHIPACEQTTSCLYMNTGSVAIPKEKSPHSYILFENGVFTWKSLSGEQFMMYQL